MYLFTDAELITQDASSPYRIENTDEEMTGMTVGLGSPALAEAMIECIQGGVHVDWVLPTEMYEQFNAEYNELSAHAVDADQTAVSGREQIPVDLAL